MKDSSVANLLILKNWSSCFSDRKKALEKLDEAERILADNLIPKGHYWYELVQDEKRKWQLDKE